jgi:hypothetical protein
VPHARYDLEVFGVRFHVLSSGGTGDKEFV